VLLLLLLLRLRLQLLLLLLFSTPAPTTATAVLEALRKVVRPAAAATAATATATARRRQWCSCSRRAIATTHVAVTRVPTINAAGMAAAAAKLARTSRAQTDGDVDGGAWGPRRRQSRKNTAARRSPPRQCGTTMSAAAHQCQRYARSCRPRVQMRRRRNLLEMACRRMQVTTPRSVVGRMWVIDGGGGMTARMMMVLLLWGAGTKREVKQRR
jgi:hypothetical protein